MINKIKEKLKEIEIKENIRILHCIESGSRAWGFASPDSDYDVRFIYIRPCEEYLRLDKTRDTIEWELNDIYDINGWDFKKVLQLLHNSNPTLFEWSASPIVYKTTDEWQSFAKEMNKYFLCKAGVYHYISTAKGNYREYLKGDEVRLKKYFYVLRPILACKWILDKMTPPPMPFEELVNEYLSGDIEKAVRDLIKLKKETPEIGTGKRVQIINDYIELSIPEIEIAANNLPASEKKDWEELNNWFLRMLGVGNSKYLN